MSYKSARILVILQKAGAKDDVITIRPDQESSGYKVDFVQNTIQNTTHTTVPNGELGQYLDRVVRTIQYDAIPYEHIQVDCPLYPTVIVTLPNLNTYLPILLDQIQSLQLNWPTEISGKQNLSKNKQTHTYEDSARMYVVLQKRNRQDDILTIEKLYDSKGYWVRYEQTELCYLNEGRIENKDLLLYLQRFMHSLLVDEEPFDAVQFDCPTYPTALVKTSNLRTYFPLLVEQVYSIQENWPYEVSGEKKAMNPHSEYDWDILGY